MRKMRRVLGDYFRILQPWLSVTAYLWLLELHVALGIGYEPLLDRLADSSAILWTLIFWLAGLTVVLWLVSIPFQLSTVRRLNHLTCRTCLILITAFHFFLWLHKWRLYHFDFGALGVIAIFLLTSAAVLSLWALNTRRKEIVGDSGVMPSLEDCFYFATLPLMIASVLSLAIKITKEMTTRASIAHASLSEKAENRLRPNIILVVYDGLRAQNMSVYGYSRKTTPYLEKFAERSDQYLQMHANSTTTQPSVTTLLSGRHPFSHGRLSREIAPYQDGNHIIRLLREHGYATAAITSNVGASLHSLGFAPYLTWGELPRFGNLTLSWLRDLGVLPTGAGTQMYENLSRIFPLLGFPERTSYYGYSDGTLMAARRVVKELRPPFFLFIHLHEPHDPYYASKPFVGRFSSPGTVTPKDRIPQGYSYYPTELQASVDYYRDRYDESIQFLDAELGKFINFLENGPWANNLLIALTADHGESFERGYFNHGEDLSENSTRVPLFIRFPRQDQAHKIRGLVQSTDVAPTILNAIGVAVPPWMQGHPLTQGNQPREAETIAVNFKHPVRGKHYPLPTKLAIWSGRYKMIVSCETGQTELYDLDEDPGEVVNLSSRSAAIVKSLKQKLALHLSAQSRRPVMSCSYE